MVEMLKLLNIYLNHFPKQEKYALANQIRKTQPVHLQPPVETKQPRCGCIHPGACQKNQFTYLLATENKGVPS